MNQHVDVSRLERGSWNSRDFEIVRTMAAAGHSDVEIGELVNRHAQSVKKFRERMGIAAGVPRPAMWSDQQTSLMERLFYAGYTDTQIAQELDKSRDAVISRRRAIGLERTKAESKPVEKSVITTTRLLAMSRPCPINAEYEERVRANAAYLIAGMRAGHAVYHLEDLPKLYRARGEA